MSTKQDSRIKHSWPPNTQVVGIRTYKTTKGGELSFQKGDDMTIINPIKDRQWYFARHEDGREGKVPVYFLQRRGEVKVTVMSWMHGKLSRDEAEQKLKPVKPGRFLVRENNNFPGDFSLSVCAEDKVEHYHIKHVGNKLTIDEKTLFENMTQLIEYYKNADDLFARLTEPVENASSFEYSVDQKSFEEEGWLIKPSHISLHELIGRGEFANVYKAEYKNTLVAAKILKEDSRATQRLLVEAAFMTQLRHPNIVKLTGVVLEGTNVQIVTEYMANGSLLEYLRSRGRTVITKESQINFARDICRGMAYMEYKKLVHRDLAARNVLLNEACVAKVSDFGLTRPMGVSEAGERLPIKWIAPEAYEEHKFTNKSDMWSFGVVLWEIYSFGKVPYPRISVARVIDQIKHGHRNQKPDGCPEEIYNVMEQAWKLDPNLRPTFDSVIAMLDEMQITAM